METKVLLVYPKFPTTYWSFEYALPFVGKKSVMPPLGLLTVAGLLPAGYRVSLVDCNVRDLTREDIMGSDIVFISAMLVQKGSFERVVAMCNECGVPVAAGGPFPTSSMETIAGVDHFILNEGELTLPRFIEDWERGCPEKVYRDEAKPDLSLTPPPRYDLINPGDYSNLALQLSRGCPFSCEFCDIIELFGRVPRYKEADQFLRELDVLYGTGYRGSVFIVDDNFIGSPVKVKKVLRAMALWQEEHGHPFTFFTEASVNLARDEELMDCMIDASFEMVFLGIETPDAAALASVGKTQNLKEGLLESVKRIQHKGLQVMAGFIVGFDSDDENIFDRQIRFIEQAGIPLAMMGMLIALPGTALARRLEKEGRLLRLTSGNNTHEMGVNFTTIMPAETLRRGYRRVLAELYRPSNYFRRCLSLLKSLPKKRFALRPSQPLMKRDLMALFRSVRRQAFSRYGISYLSYLFKAMVTHVRNFPAAINLAIKGYHFFTMTEQILKADDFSTELGRSADALSEELEGIMKREASALRRCVAKARDSMLRKYRHQSAPVRRLLEIKIREFEDRCESMKGGYVHGTKKILQEIDHCG